MLARLLFMYLSIFIIADIQKYHNTRLEMQIKVIIGIFLLLLFGIVLWSTKSTIAVYVVHF